MRHFNAPPGWPPPPNVRWRPPKRWAPDASWPPAPLGWSFWVNEDGRPVRGPIGRYGGPSRAWPVAGLLTAALVVLGFGLAFGHDDPGGAAAAPAVSPTPTDPTGEPTESNTEPTSPTLPDPGEAVSTSVPTSPSPTRTPTDLVTPTPSPTKPTPRPTAPSATPVGGVYYKNCGAVRAAGKAPLLRGQPGYSVQLDPDGDGIACGRGRPEP